MTHHISKGETVAQSLKDRFDYGQNPEKTQGGELISAYECDHRTADAEFLLAKAKYKAVTSSGKGKVQGCHGPGTAAGCGCAVLSDPAVLSPW